MVISIRTLPIASSPCSRVAASSRTALVPPYVADITAKSALDRVGRCGRRPLNEASVSRVQVGRRRAVLRAAGGPVDLEDHPAGGGPRFEQFERYVRAVVGEQPRALADDQGVGKQVDLVDEVVVEQPPDQGAAAVHLQLASRLGLKFCNGGRDVTGKDGRVRPPRVGERARRDVLRPRVQGRCYGVVALICHRSPVGGKDLVGPSAEQERVGALVDLVHERRALVVEERHGPSAALESAPAVLVMAAEPLHHAVDGDVGGGRQLHGRGSLPRWLGPHRLRRTPPRCRSKPECGRPPPPRRGVYFTCFMSVVYGTYPTPRSGDHRVFGITNVTRAHRTSPRAGLHVDEERPITGRPFLVPLYVPHFTARSRSRMWSPSPDPRIIAVTALVTLVNSVDKPERPTRGGRSGTLRVRSPR